MGRPKLDIETADYIYINHKGNEIAVWYNDSYYSGDYGTCELRTTKNVKTGRVQYYYTVFFDYGINSRQTMSAKVARHWCDNGKEFK